jgi:hypothetical protein
VLGVVLPRSRLCSLPPFLSIPDAMVDKEQYTGFAGRFRSLFDGRSTIASQSLPSSVVSPKSPAPRLGVSILSGPRIDLPGLPSHLSPSSRSPTSPHPDLRAGSPSPTAIAAPPSARSRQHPSSAFPPTPPIPRSERSSPRSNWDWEHVRDSSGNTRRRRRRLREAVRPRGAKKSLLREKAGRLKLIRCLGLGLLLTVGLSVCKLTLSRKWIYWLTIPTRSGACVIGNHSGSPGAYFDDSCWSSSRHGVRTRHGPPLHVHTAASPIST